jgi:hypothetical protein
VRNEREKFAKELLDALDSIESRKDPTVEKIVQAVKEFIRDLRDRKSK